jgi:hypothetical protein
MDWGEVGHQESWLQKTRDEQRLKRSGDLDTNTKPTELLSSILLCFSVQPGPRIG